MSTTTTAVCAGGEVQGGFSAKLAAALAILRGDLDDGTRLHVLARTQQIGREQLFLNRIETGWLPKPVLELLEDPGWLLAASPALLLNDAAIRSHVVFSRWACPAQMEGAIRRPDDAARGLVFERLAAWELRPTGVLDAGTEIAAIWRLDAALSLAEPAGLQDVLDVQSRLASALSAATTARRYWMPGGQGQTAVVDLPAHDPRGFLPVAGFVCDLSRPTHVQIPSVDPTAVYRRADIERAIERARRRR